MKIFYTYFLPGELRTKNRSHMFAHIALFSQVGELLGVNTLYWLKCANDGHILLTKSKRSHHESAIACITSSVSLSR